MQAPLSIRRRLLIFLLPSLGLLMLLSGLVDFLTISSATRNAYDQALGTAAVAAAGYLRTDGGQISFALPAYGDALLRADRGGHKLYSVVGPTSNLIAGDALLPAAPTDSDNPSFRDATLRGVPLRVASYRAETALGSVRITLAETSEGRARTQRLLLSGKLLVDFAQLDITLLLVWIGIHFGLRPLQRLRAQVEASNPRELPRFNESEVSVEVRPLVAAFNRLLELLQEAANSQRRFVADAAHQLRTPVAGLLAQTELLIREPQAADLGPRLALVFRGLQQLSHSSNQLLALARAEPAATSPGKLRPVDLKALVEQQVERNIDRAVRSQLDLGADAHAATVSGDPRLLEDLLNNLVDNALKYTPAGGHITVHCGLDDGRPILAVEDDGIGIPEEERQRVRERFYRRDGAAGEGCGLGLAIVEEIARLHKAVFTIAAGPGGAGSRMSVRFPAASVASVKHVS